MPEYKSPGVYVEEVPSGANPVAGVSTSTAGFVGQLKATLPLTKKVVDKFKRDKDDAKIYELTERSDTKPDLCELIFEGASKTVKPQQVKKTKVWQLELTAGQVQKIKKDEEFTVTYTVQQPGSCVFYEDVIDEVVGKVGDNNKAAIDEAVGKVGDKKTTTFPLQHYQALETGFTVKIGSEVMTAKAKIKNDDPMAGESNVVLEETAFRNANATDEILVTYERRMPFPLRYYQALESDFTVKIGSAVMTAKATIKNDDPIAGQNSVVLDEEAFAKTKETDEILVTYKHVFTPLLNELKLCTNFGEFKKHFGDFSPDAEGQNRLAHAVYGFFNNGGTRCYVLLRSPGTAIDAALEELKAHEEISIVAAPGPAPNDQLKIKEHCENLQDRFAILDGNRHEIGAGKDLSLNPKEINTFGASQYAALYFPWIIVQDPATGTRQCVPPSGHLAGLYARTDAERGVHKAPANAVIRGALAVEKSLSKRHQDGLNPKGINVIRDFNGNVTVWGARTLGGDANGEWKYVNVRRLFLYLRQSIDEGTRWVVFEPNDMSLWANITRNISAFLTDVWRSGALFGATAQEAFYVKCDAETNPLEVRDQGQVVTEIGVAVVKPAEFVIFRISQWAGPGE